MFNKSLYIILLFIHVIIRVKYVYNTCTLNFILHCKYTFYIYIVYIIQKINYTVLVYYVLVHVQHCTQKYPYVQ